MKSNEKSRGWNYTLYFVLHVHVPQTNNLLTVNTSSRNEYDSNSSSMPNAGCASFIRFWNINNIEKRTRKSWSYSSLQSQTSKKKDPATPWSKPLCSRFLSGVEVYHTSTTNLYSINTDATYQIRAHFLHAPHGTGGQKFNQGFRQGETFHVFRQVQIRVPFTILSLKTSKIEQKRESWSYSSLYSHTKLKR